MRDVELHSPQTADSSAANFSQSSEKKEASSARRAALLSRMRERHENLSHVNQGFERVQKRTERLLDTCLRSIGRAQRRKVDYLQSLRRELLAELLLLEWVEGFQTHCRMALPAREFLDSTGRHEKMVQKLLGGGMARSGGVMQAGLGEFSGDDNSEVMNGTLSTALPSWMHEEVVVEGHLDVVMKEEQQQNFNALSSELNLKLEQTDPLLDRGEDRNEWRDLNGGASSGGLTQGLGKKVLTFSPVPGDDRSPGTRKAVLQESNYKEAGDWMHNKEILQAQQPVYAAAGTLPIYAAAGTLQPSTEASSLQNPALSNINTGSSLLTSLLLQKLEAPCNTRPAAYGTALALLDESLPKTRLDLLSRLTELLSSQSNGAFQALVTSACEQEVAQMNSFTDLYSVRSMLAGLAQAVLRLERQGTLFLEQPTTTLLKRVTSTLHGNNSAETTEFGLSALFPPVDDFLSSVCTTGKLWPKSLVALAQILYRAASTSKDTSVSGERIVAGFFLARLLGPCLLRLAQRDLSSVADGNVPPPQVASLSRLFQKIAGEVEGEGEEGEFLVAQREKLMGLASDLIRQRAPAISVAPKLESGMAASAPGKIVALLEGGGGGETGRKMLSEMGVMN